MQHHQSIQNKITSKLVVCTVLIKEKHRLTPVGARSLASHHFHRQPLKVAALFLPTNSCYPWTGLWILSCWFSLQHSPLAVDFLCTLLLLLLRNSANCAILKYGGTLTSMCIYPPIHSLPSILRREYYVVFAPVCWVCCLISFILHFIKNLLLFLVMWLPNHLYYNLRFLFAQLF